MQHPTQRRAFLRRAAAGAAWLAGAARAEPPAAAAAAGKMLFGFPPGSATARIGNALLKEMQGHYAPSLGTELTCVAGAAGGRCIEMLRHAAPDGATAMYLPSSPLTLTAQAHNAPGGNVLQTLTPTATVARFTYVFVVGSAVPSDVATMADYARWLRQNRVGGAFGTTGAGSAPHHIGLSVARVAELPLAPVAYQGHAAQIKDLVDGALQAAVLILGTFEPERRDGRLRALAVTGAQRWPGRPELPTLHELGLSDIDVTSTLGVHLPLGTAAEKVQELNAAVQLTLGKPGFDALLTDSQLIGMPGTPQDFTAALALEQAAWSAIVKKSRFD